MSSHNNGLRMLAAALLGLVPAGCHHGGEAGADSSRNFAADSAVVREAPAPLDLGEDWAAGASGAARRDGPGPAEHAAASSGAWAIVLGTFSHGDHRAAAETMVRSCATLDPRLREVRVHTTAKGSMVVYGRYAGAGDPAARRDLEWIKKLQLNGRPIFPRALLTPIATAPSPDRFKPFALLSVRRRHPNVHPLYTLEIGVWGDFDSGTMTPEQVHERAEAQVRGLRGQNFEAYFHHDDERGLSMVTVGVFDHTAFDPQSGLHSPEVDALLRLFPAHLVNGAPLNEPIDPRRPALGTRVQKPRLVLVPDE